MAPRFRSRARWTDPLRRGVYMIHLFNEKLREWEDYYNYHRPHGALGG